MSPPSMPQSTTEITNMIPTKRESSGPWAGCQRSRRSPCSRARPLSSQGLLTFLFPTGGPLTRVLDVNSTQVDGNATVMAEFKINLFNISGLKVEALNITGEPYKPYKARIPTAYFAWSPGSHCFLRFPLYRVLRVSPSLGNSRSERKLKGETGGEPKCPFLVSFLTLMF